MPFKIPDHEILLRYLDNYEYTTCSIKRQYQILDIHFFVWVGTLTSPIEECIITGDSVNIYFAYVLYGGKYPKEQIEFSLSISTGGIYAKFQKADIDNETIWEDQVPSSISKSAIESCNVITSFRIGLGDDLSVVAGAIGLNPEEREKIYELPDRMAVTKHGEKRPIRIEIPYVED